jgi:AraC-like DNA-binding protein
VTERVAAWRPGVAGITEVLHARFVDHTYPVHTHDTWTLLIVDEGSIRYDLDRSAHGAVGDTVTLLPPHVPHDGRAASRDGFRKRVLYLDDSVLDPGRIGAAVDQPSLDDAWLRRRVHRLHLALRHPGDELEAETELALVRQRIERHLSPRPAPPEPHGSRRLASRLRDLLESRVTSGITLGEAAGRLNGHPTHLVRSFTATYGLPPHAYLTGRRIDLARRLLLAGQRPARVAAAAGFYDQPHLTRQFKRYLGVTPAEYARGQPMSRRRKPAKPAARSAAMTTPMTSNGAAVTGSSGASGVWANGDALCNQPGNRKDSANSATTAQ